VTASILQIESELTAKASPLQQLHSSILEEAGIQLYVKRDDLLHTEYGGNKWRKLKYNLIEARRRNQNTLLTFGGAWSNHIYATAAAGRDFNFNTIGIIRGEKQSSLNPTLAFAESCGMQLHYVNRNEYRQRNNPDYVEKIRQKFGDIYLLPEGGSNALAVEGCTEIVKEIDRDFDIICCACGTGATLAGIINALSREQSAIGFSALKGEDLLSAEVKKFLIDNKRNNSWRIENRFHFGGYAKVSDQLIRFLRDFEQQFAIPLDAVYTAKMFYGLLDLIKKGHFAHNSKIIAVHSGGLQGNKGFNL